MEAAVRRASVCDKKVPIKLKAQTTVIKPIMIYGTLCWAVTTKYENRLHVAEMRMLRWIRGKTRKDHVRNQIIQEDAKLCQMSTFLRQKRLNWYGHVKRREEDNLSRKMRGMVVPGNRRRGRLDGDGSTTTEKIIYDQIRTDSWHDWKQFPTENSFLLENDDEDRPTNMWRSKGPKRWECRSNPVEFNSSAIATNSMWSIIQEKTKIYFTCNVLNSALKTA